MVNLWYVGVFKGRRASTKFVNGGQMGVNNNPEVTCQRPKDRIRFRCFMMLLSCRGRWEAEPGVSEGDLKMAHKNRREWINKQWEILKNAIFNKLTLQMKMNHSNFPDKHWFPFAFTFSLVCQMDFPFSRDHKKTQNLFQNTDCSYNTKSKCKFSPSPMVGGNTVFRKRMTHIQLKFVNLIYESFWRKPHW